MWAGCRERIPKDSPLGIPSGMIKEPNVVVPNASALAIPVKYRV
jgi:hypothetical protein